jgi:hypothetical protein
MEEPGLDNRHRDKNGEISKSTANASMIMSMLPVVKGPPIKRTLIGALTSAGREIFVAFQRNSATILPPITRLRCQLRNRFITCHLPELAGDLLSLQAASIIGKSSRVQEEGII